MILVCKVFASIVQHVCKFDVKTFAEKGVSALTVNHLALLVHHIVIFQKAFTDTEVVFLDFFLRPFDGFRNDFVLNYFAFFQAHSVHQGGDSFRTEQPHKVVFQRNKKL